MSIEISFIVPCFNEQDWIPSLLQSLNDCEVDFSKVELIVVDNCSTDRTVDTAWSLSKIVQFDVRIAHEFRPGVSFARNTGALKAKGTTLVFVDADNRLTSDFVNRVIELHETTDFLGATVRTLAEPGSFYGSLVFYLLELVKIFSPKPFGKSVTKKSAFLSAGGFDTSVKLGENVLFTSAIKRIAKEQSKIFTHIKSPIYCSLRRFQKIGYLRILGPWLIAYLGAKSLPYERYDQL